MFKKRKWSKYEHVMFVQDFRSGIKTYELLVRTDELTGETNYKKIYVKGYVHYLHSSLTDWFNSK